MVTVSVIIPTYERAAMVRRAIESALDQTLADIEVIVVDDASTDRTRATVAAFDDPRVEYVAHGENQGGAAARNTGLERASGEYVAFLDDDDEFLPAKLERQVAALESRSDEWVAAYCDYAMVERGVSRWLRRPIADRAGLRERREGGSELVPLVLTNNLDYGGASTLLVERETVAAMDGFDPAFPRHQDREFVARLLRHGKLAYVDEELLRRHDTGDLPPEQYEEGSRLLLEKFADDVSLDEYDVHAIHRFDIGRHYIKHGQFATGVRYLPRSEIQALGLGWAVVVGVAKRIRSTLTSR